MNSWKVSTTTLKLWEVQVDVTVMPFALLKICLMNAGEQGKVDHVVDLMACFPAISL